MTAPTDPTDPSEGTIRKRRFGRGALLIAVASAVALLGWVALPPIDVAIPLLNGPVAGPGIPGHIELCGRSYERGIGRHWRFEDVREGVGIEPLVVDPWTHPPCVPGACTEVAAGPCHTVIYVRVGADELVAYELQGGP